MPDLVLPILLRFDRDTAVGSKVLVRLWDILESGLYVIEIVDPPVIRGAGFSSFEDLTNWLIGSHRAADWRRPCPSKTLGRFEVIGQQRDLRCALADDGDVLVQSDRGQSMSRLVKNAILDTCPFKLMPRARTTAHRAGQGVIPVPACKNGGDFMAIAVATAVRQTLQHSLDRQRRPVSVALRSPCDTVDVFVAREVSRRGILRIHMDTDEPKLWNELMDAWDSSSEEEQRYCNAAHLVNAISNTQSPIDALSCLRQWFACGGPCDGDVPHPKVNRIISKWPTIIWTELSTWWKSRPWSSPANFNDQCSGWETRCLDFLETGSWRPTKRLRLGS